MPNVLRFNSIRKRREQIDALIIGFSVGLAGILAGLVVVGVNAVA